MRYYFWILYISIVSGCSTAKKEDTVIDSTSVVIDSITPGSLEVLQEVIQPTNEPEPFSGQTENFPIFFLKPLTTDSIEAQITNELATLIQAYDTISYYKIISNYTWERECLYWGQLGESFKGIESETETNTWFFDESFQLKAYSSEFKSEPVYPFTKTILYLLLNDSLLAVSEYWLSEDEVAVSGYDRIIASRCPTCGIASQLVEFGSSGEVQYLDSVAIITRQKEFSQSMSLLLKTLKSQKINTKADDFDLTLTIQRSKEGNTQNSSKTIKYPVTFTISKELYRNYVLKLPD
jgi:hypothetical protein